MHFRSVSLMVMTSLLAAASGCAASDAGDETTSSESSALCSITNPCEPPEPPPPPPPPPPAPDLKVVIANSDYCATGTISWRVTNAGNAPAGASYVRVTFDDLVPQYFYVPALAAGGTSAVYSRVLYYPGGDLFIDIVADATKVVAESNETNNRASGFCLG